ncbi:LPS assembly outer membrane protein LptD (organic solvent tolerance protein OstA) [Fontimonas thermophila]|uniref:LPS-assembly protein LptD n=1 Tax=Fontimonas thermophila TaxID=1076937 RepID=A0A1I2IB25_9GAMM|nr:LPS assembly outer membrane protein LptD (organic solvent tolerance protein OstA) [Fontimonas thermophila]
MQVQLIEKLQKRRQLGIPSGDPAHVTDEARHIGKVVRFAIAVVDARENPDDFEMALHPHEVASAAECSEVGIDRQTGGARRCPVLTQPVFDACLGPGQKGVAQQGDHVVADRPFDGILKIEDAGIGVGEHQIARHVIAVDEHTRLGQGRADQSMLDRGQHLTLTRRQRALQMTADVPVREQIQFALEQRGVVGRQHTGAGGALPADQGRDRIAHQRIGIVLIEHLQKRLLAEIGEKQIAAHAVLGENPRRIQAGGMQKTGDGDERRKRLTLRRRIHDDPATDPVADAEITAETGIGRSRRELGLLQPQLRQRPLPGGLGAQIGRIHTRENGIGHGVNRYGRGEAYTSGRLHRRCGNADTCALIGKTTATLQPTLPVRPLIGLILAAALAAPAHAQVTQEGCTQLTDTLPALDAPADPRLVLDADHVDLSADGRSRLSGSVQLRQGDKEFTAPALEYDERERLVEIDAPSTFRNRQLLIRAQSAHFDLDDDSGRFEGTEFVLTQRSARGESGHVRIGQDGVARLDDVRYTTCAPGSDAWYLEASAIKLDHEQGLGTARHARLRFFGVPILYAPWFQFPIDDRRRTGLLFPTVGRSDKTGWDLRVPVYFNLAPNYDATLAPRLMSDRGTQIDAEGRYLLRSAEGRLGYEFLGNDRITGERRTYTELVHRGIVGSRLGVDIHYAETSDPAYFEDLGGNVDLSSITHLERSARFTYHAPAAYTVQMLFQDYQTIASNLDPVDDPYRRLPQIRIDALTRNAIWDTRLGAVTEYANFVRPGSVEGQRIDLHPYLRMEKDRIAWFARSQVDFRYTAYELTGTAPGQPSRPDRALPIFSAEYGLRFDRITPSGAPQTLEPRLFYLYVPYEDQSQLPIFDSGEPDFDVTQLFARNRFSGEDRISDANHFAFAVTGRQLDPDSGILRASATIGQLFRFQSPRVRLPDEPPPDRGATDFIAAFDYALSERWGTYWDTQWSPEDADFTRSSVGLRYRSDRRRAELAYRYRANLLEQTDVIVSTPLWNNLSLLGRWRYSLRDRESLDTIASIQYETCCWALRTSYRRYVANTSGERNSGIYLLLELKGLARIGSRPPNLFRTDAVE